jgi:hypothetical protein
MASTLDLPLLDLSGDRDPATITNIQKALLRYGAIRLWAPSLKGAHFLELQQNVSILFILFFILLRISCTESIRPGNSSSSH